MKLLQLYKPRKVKADSKSISFEGNSFGSTITNSFREKLTEKKLKREPEAIQELSEIFKKLSSERKRLTISRIFQCFTSSKYFTEDANYLYNLFHFKLQTELTMEVLIELLNKRVVKRTSFLRRRNLSQGYSKETRRESICFNPIQTKEMDARTALRLEKIFDKFDTNHDGEVDYKELKSGLKEDFDKVVIKDLFKSHVKKGQSSLGLKDFIELFAPANMEITAESLRHLQSRIK